jgi:hypothetical protein
MAWLFSETPVAKFVKHYLTYEGRYQVVYQHDFFMLSHLRHNRLVNIPYYLLGCLKNMLHYCKKAKDLLTGEIVHLSIERVEPVKGCLNNPSRLE